MHITKNSVVALTLKPVTVIHLTDEELDILALLKDTVVTDKAVWEETIESLRATRERRL